MIKTKYPEVLAPVGDFERLETALLYGADAVYLGSTEYGMRSGSANFDIESLRRAVDMAHEKGVRVYLTCNVLPETKRSTGWRIFSAPPPERAWTRLS